MLMSQRQAQLGEKRSWIHHVASQDRAVYNYNWRDMVKLRSSIANGMVSLACERFETKEKKLNSLDWW